ncbi:hypothetical protein CSAL01_01508 [Colletotrichum salicis]|uniref:Uncharacterized protein n=1 Tax=Colletotrichum salicis TaxID=1209931 RepID=A0A135V4Y4_9PEZI|nr:hypothetical protein CSAL01_01508 [Colletotrichum salicis]
MNHYVEDVQDLLISGFQLPINLLQTQCGHPTPSSSTELCKHCESSRVPHTPPESTINWKSYWVSKPKPSVSEESVLSQDQVCSLTFSGTESKSDLSFSPILQRNCECQLGIVSPVATHFCQQTQVPTPCSIFSETRTSNYPSDHTQLLMKLETLHLRQEAQPSQLQLCESESSNEAKDVDMISLDDFNWESSDSFRDFTEDPAHEFWKWDETVQQWAHQDEDTKSVVYCPVELD